MIEIPLYSADLIKKLDELYPIKPPRLDMPDRKIWYEAGKREVVNSLLSALKVQEEESLKGGVIK